MDADFKTQTRKFAVQKSREAEFPPTKRKKLYPFVIFCVKGVTNKKVLTFCGKYCILLKYLVGGHCEVLCEHLLPEHIHRICPLPTLAGGQ